MCITIRIKKRDWYIWLFWIVWLFWLAFWADLGFSSIKEREPRAAVIAFVVLGISLIASYCPMDLEERIAQLKSKLTPIIGMSIR